MAEPTTTRRDQVYELLRSGEWVTLDEFYAAGIHNPRPHIESLRFEGGHVIEYSRREDDSRLVERWRLERDAWASDEEAA